MFSPVEILDAAELLGIEMEDVRIAGAGTQDETTSYSESNTEEDTTGNNETTSGEETPPFSEASLLKAPAEGPEMPEREGNIKEVIKKEERHVTCIFCEFETTDMAIMKNHVNDHPKEEMYKCKICDRPLKKHCMKEHIQIRHGDLRFDCPECGHQTCDKSALTKHRFRRHNVGSKQYHCTKCRYRAQLKKFFIRHMQEKHSIFDTDEVDKYSKPDSLRSIEGEAYSTSGTHFFCNICNLRKRNENQMTDHLKEEHNLNQGKDYTKLSTIITVKTE